MIIYKITNLITGKLYIGQTRSTLKKRFSQHCERRNKTVISLALKKYGKCNFSITPLIEGVKTQADANREEQRLIEELNTVSPNGYNIENGGNVCAMLKGTKLKISKALKGRKVTWGTKVSTSVKKLWEEPEYREKQVKQRRSKRGKYRKGIVKPLRINLPIVKINEMYRSGRTINFIAKYFSVSFYTIKKRLICEK